MGVKVYKFGGTSLEGRTRIENAIEVCASEVKKGNKIVVVVSAMGKTTDELYTLVQEVNPKITVEDSIEIVGMGEIISARLMSVTMRRRGISTHLVEPFCEEWPIFLKKDGSVHKSLTKKRTKELFKKVFQEVDCVVVPGFVGLRKNGTWGTLGRGGSDTTAFILGRYIDADEIIMVKDVDGIFSADPSVFPEANHLKFIRADDLSALSSFGSQVIHSNALSFKGEKQKVRIIHHSFGDLSYEGTVVDGTVERKLYLLENRLALITIYKKDITGERDLVEDITRRIMKKTKAFGVTLGIDYLGFYVPLENSGKVIRGLGPLSKRKLFSVVERRNVALLVMRRESPTNLPGMINSLLTPLTKKNLNIVEVISIGREVLVFIRWEDRERAMDALKKQVKRKK
jgi:aspartate kinase